MERFRISFQTIFIIISSLNHGQNSTNCKHFLELVNHFYFRIGDENMILLLTECSIFISLPDSNNLLQIAGKPLSEESVKVPSKSNFPATTSSFVYITRSKILYGKQVCARNENIIGLPFKRKNIKFVSSVKFF